MPVAEFDRPDAAHFDVVKESGNAAGAAGASIGVVAGSFVPAPIVGPALGAVIGFGIGKIIGRAFAIREVNAKTDQNNYDFRED